MYKVLVVFAWALLSSCSSIPVEDSVVSVYTTQSTTAGTNPSLDVYHQIANNLAERITSPIYRFLGFNRTTEAQATTTKPLWPDLELLDDQDLTTKHEFKPVDNDIEKTRDVEELSPGLMKPQKKPEKITLYSSFSSTYLPAKLTANDSKKNDNFDGLNLEDVDMDRKKGREGPFIYVMEFIGSVFQLIWGGLTSIFKPSSGSSSR